MSSSAMYGQPAGTMCPTLTTWQPHQENHPRCHFPPEIAPSSISGMNQLYHRPVWSINLLLPLCFYFSFHQMPFWPLSDLNIPRHHITAVDWFFPRCLIVADLAENALPCNLIVLACEIYSFFNQKLLLVLFCQVQTESHSVTDPWLNLNNDDGPREI